ncbi:heat shock protein 70 kDa [Trifolium pratense]|uniref:Uncharacterized protein n=2 Tax=Trifolium pratense TaxID=57577 RepID=A0ACB0IRN8_TRIPR|nr:heat shock protein 70 kDa [Trifolium pratense]CAJ2634665.1 unnamed protein product [Trifolium pratense]
MTEPDDSDVRDDEYIVTLASDSETTDEVNLLPPPEIPIGIDIGTWPCCVAVWNGSDFDLFSNKTNENIMKSGEIFKFDSSSIGVISTSEVSLSQDQVHDMSYEATIYNMRRLIGRIDTDPVVHASKNFPFRVQTLDIGVHPLISEKMTDGWRYTTVEHVLAVYLSQLRVLAETQLKRPVRNVVFTVPVSFNRFQLNRIYYACVMAGLVVLKLMPQPTAVALLYAQQQLQASSSSSSSHEDMDSESNKIALIFNMDSGYCDVAVTLATERECQMKALAGSAIGGEDLLGNLMNHLLPDSKNKFKKHLDGDKEIKSMSILRAATLEAIHRLSSQTSVEFDLDLGDGLKICKVVKREEFEKINNEVFEKCERLIKQCLQDANVKVEDINDVIIVGECYHIPRVKNIVTKICKVTELYKGMDPLTASVCGAAVAGAIAPAIHHTSGNLDLLTSHVTPLTVGIRANGNNLVPVIPRNTSVPTTRVIDFTTIHDNQTEALILVYEGEGQKAEENQLLGYLKIMGIPATPKGVPKIYVGMVIDSKNELRVIADVYMPGLQQPVIPAIGATMPMSVIDDGHFWHAEALNRTYGDTMDLVTLLKNK